MFVVIFHFFYLFLYFILLEDDEAQLVAGRKPAGSCFDLFVYLYHFLCLFAFEVDCNWL